MVWERPGCAPEMAAQPLVAVIKKGLASRSTNNGCEIIRVILVTKMCKDGRTGISPKLSKYGEGQIQWLVFPYRGNSMSGTFRRGDILFVTCNTIDEIEPGDVILFCPEGVEENITIVHRVLLCRESGVVTQGDARRFPDGEVVREERLVGRVIYVEREGQRKPVWHGRAGQLRVAFLRLRRIAFPLLGWLYRRLRASDLVAKFWRPCFSQIHLVTGEGPLIKYVQGRRTVAHWQPDRERFWCRKPYDLVLKRPDLETQDSIL